MDQPVDAGAREALLAAASPETRAIVYELEGADARAPSRFATVFPTGTLGDLPRPTLIASYRLDALLGVGGMGEVWRAVREDGLFEQVVAIKLIRPGIMSAIATERFVEERRLLAQLDHAGIARILDGGVTTDGWPYLIMEYIDGVPIDVWSDEHKASVHARVEKVAAAVAAVQSAHARLIAHADIKPDNLLVTKDGQVKLIDFGISERIEAGQGAPIRPMTREFASPERLDGGSPSVPDDLYALGMVLGALVPPAERDPDLDAIIDKARSVLPDDRYGGAEQLARDLAHWQAQRPVSARPARLGYRARLFFRRNRRVVVLAGALLALSVLFGGIAIRDRRTARLAQLEEAQRAHDLLTVNHYLLFDLDPRLAGLDHSLTLRAALADRAQAYLDQLGSLPDARADVRIEAAQGFQQLASIQDRPGSASLGQPRAALSSLGRADRMIDSLPGAQANRTAVGIRLDQARLQMFAIADLAGAERSLADAAARLRRLGADGAPLTGDFLLLQAQQASWQSRYQDEVRLARAALRAPTAADPRRAVLFRINATGLVGEGLFYDSKLPQSLAAYQAERRLTLAAAQRWPADASMLRERAHSAWDLGSTLLEIGRARDALAVLDQGVTEIRELTQRQPEDDEAARLRNIIEDNEAQALGKLGRTREAIRRYDAGVARWGEMWRREPNPVRLRDYAIALNIDGTVHAEAGDQSQACRLYGQAYILFEGLRANGRIVPFDQQETLRSITQNRARYCP